MSKLSYKTLFIIFCTLLIGVIVLLRFFLIKPNPAAAWWNDMWQYRRAISIGNSGVAQTNAQIKILDNYDLSALVTAGKIQSDLDDLRFTDINGNLIKYWIEDSTNNSVDIWGFIPSSPTSGTTIYMYYGNSSASAGKTTTGTSDYPGVSCQSIKLSGISTDGIYYIDPTAQETSDKFQAYCDMTTDSGGWTLSLRLNTNDSDIQQWSSSFWTSSSEQGSITNNNDYLSPSYYTLNGWDKILIDYRYTSGQVKKMAAVFSGSNTSTLKSQTTMTLNNNNPDWVRTYTNNSEAANWYGLNLKFQTVGNGNDNARIWYNRVDVNTCNQNGGIGVCGDCSIPNFYSEVSPPCNTTSCQWNGSCGVAGINGKEYNVNCSKTLPIDAYDEGIMYVLIKESVISTTGHTVTVSNLSSEEVGTGPIAYWKFDEGIGTTTYDSLGNYNGTISGATWTSEDQCISGKCLSFNGASYVNTNFGINRNISTKPLTVSMWVKPTVAGSYMFLSPNQGSNQRFYFATYSGKWDMGIQSAGWGGVGGSINVDLNKWAHVEIVANGSTVYMYINGKITSQKNYTSFTFPENIYIGIHGSSGAYGFYGLIDEVKIYPYARTAAQIKLDYNSRGSLKGSSVNLGVKSNTAPSLKSGLVAHYKFDEGGGTIVNNSGNGGIGLSGVFATGSSSPNWTQGKFSKALSFSSAQFVRVPTNSAFSYNQDGFTYTAWIRPTTLNPTYNMFMGQMLPYFNVHTNRLHLSMTAAGSQRSVYGNTQTITTGQWYHVSATYDSQGYMKVYLNGKIDGTAGPFLVPTNYGNPLYIGKWTSDGSYPFNGIIDEIKIYNTALTADEIKQDYNKGSALQMGQTSQTIGATTTSLEYCIPGDTSYCASPVAEWNFEENTGTVAKDTSGNNNNFTFNAGTSAPTWTIGKKNIGSALSFNGTSNFLDKTPLSPSIAANTDYTQCLWFYPTSSATRQVMIDDQNQWEHWIALQTDKKVVGCYYNVSQMCVTSATAISLNTWNNVCLSVQSGQKMSLYLNGLLSNTNSNIATTLPKIYDDVCVGSAGSSAHNEKFTGKIDNVRIYNYARTPAQIAYDYNKGAPIAWWKFDECQGNIANDSSGIGNTGSINIGAAGTQNSLGTCAIGTSAAWTFGASGKINSSLNFDGNDDYLDLTGFTSQSTTNTISLWINSKDNNSRYFFDIQSGRILLGWGSDTAGQIGVYDGTWRLFGNSPSINVWHHLVFVLDGSISKTKMYLDGTQYGSQLDYTPHSIGGTIHLGSRYSLSGTWYGFNGQIDDVRIYNYALTTEQIKTLYNGGGTSFN